jgi:1-deoxy-D-xylulose-5-phosphate synthase
MENLLHTIDSPDDLRKLGVKQLPQIAEEIRELIIDTVSKTGGHIAASLGVVELTIALHYVFNTPHDKIVWDVGHQAYAHKILTGRREAFSTLRQMGGLSGFPKREESPYDTFNAGHSSTSISAALGMAESCRLKGQDSRVIAVIGDGSLTAGMAFEALNHAGHIKRDLIVVLNDNEMSISPNVGALSSSLSRIISGQAYNKFRDELKMVLEKIPGIGESVSRVARQSEGFFKSIFVPGMIFEELGFVYIGPVLGHRIDMLVDNLRNIRNLKGPILLHVITKKGRGYKPAEEDPTYFHGVGAFDRQTGKPAPSNGAPSYTKVFGDALVRIAENNPQVVAITAGMTSGTGLEKFQQQFPDRFYDVGIAEQHAITFAAGLAVEGFRPVAAIYSTFLQRSYDQVLHDVCMQNLPVVFMLDRAGIVGEDGPTHHGLFDISYLRALPNIVFMAPADENELQHMLFTALKLNQPVAIRYPRGSGFGVPLDGELHCLPVGKSEVLQDGHDVAIFAIGNTVHPALDAAKLLAAEGISCAVVNARFVKPLDTAALAAYARTVKAFVTVEENILQAGFGSAVLEALQDAGSAVRVLRIGLPDRFVEQGTQKQLRGAYGLDAGGIAAAVRKILADEQC